MFLIPLWMVVRESSNLQILTCKDRAIIPVNPKKLLPLWRKGDLQSSLYIYIYISWENIRVSKLGFKKRDTSPRRS